MASAIVNGPGVPQLTRGKSTNLGTLTAAASVVAFSFSREHHGTNAQDYLNVVTVGGTATQALEGSLDGTNWFGIPTISNLTVTTINSDTAVTSAARYDVSGLNGATFRLGTTAITGSPVVWALLG